MKQVNREIQQEGDNFIVIAKETFTKEELKEIQKTILNTIVNIREQQKHYRDQVKNGAKAIIEMEEKIEDLKNQLEQLNEKIGSKNEDEEKILQEDAEHEKYKEKDQKIKEATSD